MKFSDIKKIRAFCKDLHSSPDWREVVENWGQDDFEVGGVRFIDTDSIDSIQQDELSIDLYVLGCCFSSWFLSDVLDVSMEFVENLQKSENFVALGMLIIEKDALDELQREYVRHDGYGHHFNHYDGNEEEIEIDGTFYHVFDNRE